ncbi:MAG: hypothetical protein LCH92_15485 [Proteobacteria bacterium]|nr:hypothetical protein [Pseudomonadota bacterium]
MITARPLARPAPRRRGLLAAGLGMAMLGAATQAGAEDFTPPAGCTAYLAVQTRACTVSQHYTCTDTPGGLWRMDFDEQGAFYQGLINAEAQWVESRSLPSGTVTRTEFPARDAASVSTLLSSGYDDWDFDEIRAGERVRVTGFDRLTGGTEVIDGETLLGTEFETRYYDATGALISTITGREYVSATHRRFFSGIRTWRAGDEETTSDNSPAEFLYPGDPGFASTQPRHNCGPMLSALATEEGHA